MEALAGLVGVAITLFAVTNIDDLFVLLALFADAQLKSRDVVVGQCCGIALLYAVSVAAALIAVNIAPAHVGWLGLVPIAIGLHKGWILLSATTPAEADEPVVASRYGQALAVAIITVANGADNISVYTPLFAARSASDIALIGFVFALMTLAWLWLAYWLTAHRTMGATIRYCGRIALPFVLIALGVSILREVRAFF